jgi:hypothetical protein
MQGSICFLCVFSAARNLGRGLYKTGFILYNDAVQALKETGKREAFLKASRRAVQGRKDARFPYHSRASRRIKKRAERPFRYRGLKVGELFAKLGGTAVIYAVPRIKGRLFFCDTAGTLF